MKHKVKLFKPTSWSIDNKTSIYVLTIIIALIGISTFNSLPKEQFPEIVIPTISVQTIYPGTSPTDMENLITRKIEKKIKSISGIKKLSSNSMQDFSVIIVEFNTGISVADAKQKVKDAVDKAKMDLPTDLQKEPETQEVNFSDFPIMNVNISGDYDLNRLKKYADALKDKIEELKTITRVDLIGAPQREIQINVDMYRLEAARMTMDDIARAVGSENIIISGGNIPMNGTKRAIKVDAEFSSVNEIKNLIVNSVPGAPIYLRDVAEVIDTAKEKESFARLGGKNVLTLNVIKRAGENLIQTSDNINKIIADMRGTVFPADLDIKITGDQSNNTRRTLTDLINSIIIGFILVTIVLMFFMGVTNALFVGLSVPLSIFIAFMFMPTIGFNLNMIVLFSLLFALGIIVDDAIVVIENTHRIYHQNKMGIGKAAKVAAGEVFVPVLAGTLTTLAPFIPLAFWPGLIGKFMVYLPITLILTLIASLIAAFIFNPVFATSFMKREAHQYGVGGVVEKKSKKGLYVTSIIFGVIALLFYAGKNFGMGNFILFILGLVWLNKYVLTGMIKSFQLGFIPRLQKGYSNLITWALQKRRPWLLLVGTVLLLPASVVFMMIRKPAVVLFPSGEPHFIYTYIKMPIGTDQFKTDSITRVVENKIYKIIRPDSDIVDAVISNVALGAGDPMQGQTLVQSNLGRVVVAFKEFEFRNGKSTTAILDSVRANVKGIPGVQISVDQEKNGPPTGLPISIEITGDDLNQLIKTSKSLKHYLDSCSIPGVENLKSNLDDGDPEVLVLIDRERAARAGLSSVQLGLGIRNAVFGKEITKYREFEDEYPVMLRFSAKQRKDIDALQQLKITFRDMNTGMIKQVPLSAVATIKYDKSLGIINRKNMKRYIILSSNVLSGFTPDGVNATIKKAIDGFKLQKGIEVKQTGEAEDQAETSAFLGNAMLMSLMMIFLILVTQFNSVGKPLIILSEIIFSVIGVFLGIAFFKMNFVVIMTGMGIVGLAGIVVKNGILLVEFTDELRQRGYKTRAAIIEAGKIRMIPVLLTASATILALVPLAVGFNIDFVSLFTHGNPKIYLGGDSVVFWGPLSWTIIFGLGFATFLTLILVPSMYYIGHVTKLRWKRRLKKWFGMNLNKKEEEDDGNVIL